MPVPKVAFYTQTIFDNDNSATYKIIYYTDGSAQTSIFKKNFRTNCYQLVRVIEVAECASPVPYVPPV